MSRPVRFVTGTDTGVGKTVATAALVAALRAAGGSPYVVKPAQSGVTTTEDGDLDEVRRLAGPVPGHEGVRLRAALAPDVAARLEGVRLPELATQAAAITEAAAAYDVVVEGAGGILVGLGSDWTLLDLAGAVTTPGTQAQFVVVARAGLGTLNHAALTVRAIERAGHTVEGLVIGSWPETPGLAETENLSDLPRITGVPLLGSIPDGAGSWAGDRFAAAAPGWITLGA